MIPIGIANGAKRTRLNPENFDTATHKCVAVQVRNKPKRHHHTACSTSRAKC